MTTVADDTRDKVIRLEAEVEGVREDIAEMKKHVKAMHDLLMQAKGARWAIVGLATLGGILAGRLPELFHWFTLK